MGTRCASGRGACHAETANSAEVGVQIARSGNEGEIPLTTPITPAIAVRSRGVPPTGMRGLATAYAKPEESSVAPALTARPGPVDPAALVEVQLGDRGGRDRDATSRIKRITHVATRFKALITDEANDELTPEQLFLTVVDDAVEQRRASRVRPRPP